MAVTVVPGDQGGQGNADNVLSVMNSINQRRKEIEQQQRGMEYEFINNYAASHGGFAGIAAMPGGDKMLQHYATNVMGYSPEVVPEFQKAIEQGYNPDEALYQINNNLAFTRSQQTGQQDQIVETQQTQQTRTPWAVDPNVVSDYTRDKQVGRQGGMMTPNKTADNESDIRYGTGGYEEPSDGGMGGAGASRNIDTGQPIVSQKQMGPTSNQFKAGTGGPVRASGQPSGILGTRSGEVKEMKAQADNTRYARVQEEELAKIRRENGTIEEMAIDEDNAYYLTSDILRTNTNLFSNQRIPPYDEMNQKQQIMYNKVHNYVKTQNATSTASFLQGLKQEFDTINKKEVYKGTSKDNAAMKQVERKAVSSMKRLPNIKDYANLTTDEAMRYRQVVDDMMANDPQRWAETFKQSFNVKKELTDQQYKRALTGLVGMQMKAQQLDAALKQQQLENPEQAEAATAMSLIQLFMKNPSLAENESFKAAADTAGGILMKVLGNMLEEDGTVKVSLKQNSRNIFNFWKNASDRGFTVETLVNAASGTSMGGGQSGLITDVLNQMGVQ